MRVKPQTYQTRAWVSYSDHITLKGYRKARKDKRGSFIRSIYVSSLSSPSYPTSPHPFLVSPLWGPCKSCCLTPLTEWHCPCNVHSWVIFGSSFCNVWQIWMSLYISGSIAHFISLSSFMDSKPVTRDGYDRCILCASLNSDPSAPSHLASELYWPESYTGMWVILVWELCFELCRSSHHRAVH